MKKILLFILFILASQVAGAQWVQCKGPYGGYVSTLVVADNSIMYAGTSNGVYKSTNRKDWVPVNNGLKGRGVRSMLAKNSSELYAAVEGEGIYSSMTKVVIGIL